MKIMLEWDNGETIVIERDPAAVKSLVQCYPEVSMMRTMEELAELSQAISKGVVNDSHKKLENVCEEIVDVLDHIPWILERFNLTAEDFKEVEKEKTERFTKRAEKDSVVFRSGSAREQYHNHTYDPTKTWGITEFGDGELGLIGLRDPDSIGSLAKKVFDNMKATRRKFVDLGGSSSILHTPDIRAVQAIANAFDATDVRDTETPVQDPAPTSVPDTPVVSDASRAVKLASLIEQLMEGM